MARPVRARRRPPRTPPPARVRRRLPFAAPTGHRVVAALALVAGAVLAGLVLYQWARPALLPHLVRVEEARAGRLETVLAARAAVLREERVLTAPVAGVVQPAVGEGERVRTGATVCRVDGHAVAAPAPGVVSLVTDGTEGRLHYEPGKSPPAPAVLGLQPHPHRLRPGEVVTVGQPLARVVDASRLHLCLVLPPGEVAELAQADRLRVRLPGGREIAVRPEAHYPGDDRTYGTLTTALSEPAEELVRERLLDVEVIKSRASGVLIPKRALVERDGQTGVFVVRKTLAQWVRVEVKGEKEGTVAVEGIAEGSQVITNPWLVREGAIVR